MDKADFLICGGGILGLSIARELLARGHGGIVVLDKEDSLGLHASGRNSGVLHAGIYYSPDSLRAQSCLKGNFLMQNYCRERGLPIKETGKVIVAKNDSELDTLRELYNRATANGAEVELIDEKQLAEVEPNAKTHKTAIYSPRTAVVSPGAIVRSLYGELSASGKVQILLGTAVAGIKGDNTVITNRGEIAFDTFINTSGAFSDRIARLFGVGLNYRLIPFKGIYRRLVDNKAYLVRGNIYPVPDIRNPFLGVHFTKGIDGVVYIGPTAIPALGRENYGILEGISTEALSIIFKEAMMVLTNPKFKTLAFSEIPKYFFRYFYEDARGLVKDLDPSWITSSDKIGIRPQLVDMDTKELVMDFTVLKGRNSIHVLNPISPAFTSSMYIGGLILNEYIG